MDGKGASKLSLSTFSSEELWKKTERLHASSSEVREKFREFLFPQLSLIISHYDALAFPSRRPQRREVPFISYSRRGDNQLGGGDCQILQGASSPALPDMFVYHSIAQMCPKSDFLARKYRDEPRPRQGLLRTREFLMKDLYTFDASTKEALDTYKSVQEAYAAFFNEFKIPYLVAEASSGEIGGDLSHEYHIVSLKGEDHIVNCDSCNYVANQELAKSESNLGLRPETNTTRLAFASWSAVSRDRSTLVRAIFSREVATSPSYEKKWRQTCINVNAMQALYPDLDLSVDDPQAQFAKTPISQRKALQVYDKRIQPSERVLESFSSDGHFGALKPQDRFLERHEPDLINVDTGDACAVCKTGTLKVQTAIELGHTFHLGTRYTAPLGATIAVNPSQSHPSGDSNTSTSPASPSTISSRVPIQMGCHGIGISRLVAAIADSLADVKGLNWPSVVAPFQAVVIPIKAQEAEAAGIYDLLSARDSDGKPQDPVDAIIDDRAKDFGWKLKDADMIGYPVIVVVGRDWKTEGRVEVQCRRLGVKEGVRADGLRDFVEGLLRQL